MVVVRADWSDVTLVEYAALDIIHRDNPETLLNAYWDGLHAEHRIIAAHDAPDTPTRLTKHGSAWLTELHETVLNTTDERILIASARDFVKSLGTILTMNVHRALKREV